MTIRHIATADSNFKKFHVWLDKAYKPAEIFERVYAEQDGETLHINHVWSYGSVKQVTHVCDLPIYPMFDPEFDPEKFYAQ